jgi:hypothetical protein
MHWVIFDPLTGTNGGPLEPPVKLSTSRAMAVTHLEPEQDPREGVFYG